MTLENDDRTFNAAETLDICEQVGVPMVLDIHHHDVNHAGESIDDLWPRMLQTWSDYGGDTNLPPKIHASSPKDTVRVRSHADHVEPARLLEFLRAIAPVTPHLDVMLEAKKKDGALFRLMQELQSVQGVRMVNQAAFEIL